MAYTPLNNARRSVQSLTPFTGNSCYAVDKTVNGESMYVVYSYGDHWPLFIYHHLTDTWFENEDRCSVTTSKHRSKLHPLPSKPVKPLRCSVMVQIARSGFGAACRDVIRHKEAA